MKSQMKPGIAVKVYHKAELFGRLIDIQGNKAKVHLDGKKKPEMFHVEQVKADDEPPVIAFENQYVEPGASGSEAKVYSGSLFVDVDELEAEAAEQEGKGLKRFAVHEYRLTGVYDIDPAQPLCEAHTALKTSSGRAETGSESETKEG